MLIAEPIFLANSFVLTPKVDAEPEVSSADETSGSASTLGVSTKLFARNIGSAISTIHNDTEVFDFEYYKNASDPTSVDTTNALNKKHLLYSYYNASLRCNKNIVSAFYLRH